MNKHMLNKLNKTFFLCLLSFPVALTACSSGDEDGGGKVAGETSPISGAWQRQFKYAVKWHYRCAVFGCPCWFRN